MPQDHRWKRVVVGAITARKKLHASLDAIRSLATFSRPSQAGDAKAAGRSVAIFDILGGLEKKRVSF